MKTIKRYANRKLYDPDLGAYVNLTDIIDYVKNGVMFEVVEKKDNQRVITSEILAMAIHVHLQRSKSSAHLELLIHIVKFL